MKKHLIAAAVAAAVAVPAMAQNVSIYGTMDIGYTSSESSTSGAGAAGFNNNADANNAPYDRKSISTGNGDGGLSTSVLGFRGSEDLGGGLKADFHLQYDLVDVGNGANAFGARVSTVGLDGSFGRFQFGRDTAAIHGIVGIGLAGAGNNIAGSVYSAGGPDSVNENQIRPHSVFTSDMISYISPTMNGFQFRVDYSKNNTDRDTNNADVQNEETGASVRYSAGPLTLGMGYQDRSTQARPGVDVAGLEGAAAAALFNGFTGYNPRSLFGVVRQDFGAGAGLIGAVRSVYELEANTKAFAANYNFGPAQAFLLHTKREDGVGVAAAAAAADPSVADVMETDVTEVGVRIPLGAVGLFGSMYDGKAKLVPAPGEISLEGFQLGATYALSKRTTAYVIHGQQKADFDGAGAAAAIVNQKTEQTAIGIRHTF